MTSTCVLPQVRFWSIFIILIGICQESARFLPEFYQNPAYLPINARIDQEFLATRSLPGICQESARNLPGICQESARNLTGLLGLQVVMPGIYQESGRNLADSWHSYQD